MAQHMSVITWLEREERERLREETVANDPCDTENDHSVA